MSQFNAPVRRSGGEIDVHTGLLCAALLILAAGVALTAMANIKHSDDGSGNGSPIKLIGK